MQIARLGVPLQTPALQVPVLLQEPLLQEPPPPHCELKVQEAPGVVPPTQALPHWEPVVQTVPG